ncbi:hypothetical protein, partial [Burkholderia cenocepacia]|uniref:hypothetical protein n=1 Tax=Burkholderia cenocepacia TaxID=95486 RepID=UPI001E5C61E2
KRAFLRESPFSFCARPSHSHHRPDAFGNAPATSRTLSSASMKTAAIGRRPSSIESTRQGT